MVKIGVLYQMIGCCQAAKKRGISLISFALTECEGHSIQNQYVI